MGLEAVHCRREGRPLPRHLLFLRVRVEGEVEEVPFLAEGRGLGLPVALSSRSLPLCTLSGTASPQPVSLNSTRAQRNWILWPGNCSFTRSMMLLVSFVLPPTAMVRRGCRS